MEVLDESLRKEIISFIRESYILVLGTVTSDGKPHTTPLLYNVDDDLNFYFITHTEGEKAINIKQNPCVSFVVGEAIDRFNIQGKGEAHSIENPALQEEILFELAQKAVHIQNFWPPLFYVEGENYTIFKITPTQIKVLDMLQMKNIKGENPFLILI